MRGLCFRVATTNAIPDDVIVEIVDYKLSVARLWSPTPVRFGIASRRNQVLERTLQR